MVEGTTQGSVTDIDGYFKQGVASNATLLFKYMGYKDLKKKVTQKGASVNLGIIQMKPDAVMLKDVVITSSVAVARKTPVALSTVDPVFIEEKLGTQEFLRACMPTSKAVVLEIPKFICAVLIIVTSL